ncbi:MAG: acetyl-CoA carboxylase carboxyl transferase subunit alpha, partial [Planctomycetota bacterium]
MADLKLSEDLDFETSIIEIERKIQELDARMQAGEEGLEHEIKQLREKRDKETKRVFAELTPWQRVQLSRHPQRPTTMDYVEHMLDSWTELHGDRAFGDDPAMLTALGYLGKRRVMVIGHRKGKNLRERIDCNFGCAHPEGYRKALLKMKMAEKFGLP